jgi:uncharacterized protein YvpB
MTMAPDEFVSFLASIENAIEFQIDELKATLAMLQDERKRIMNPVIVPAVKRIDVPWLSQLSTTAGYARGDCGTACVAMLLNWKGRVVTVDEVSKATKQPAGFTLVSFSNLILAAIHFGLTLIYQRDMTLAQICADIDSGKPVICLVNYQSLPVLSRFDARYNAGHYVLVIGYDADHIIYHDPYAPTDMGGAHKTIARGEFLIAFATIAPGNSLACHALRMG